MKSPAHISEHLTRWTYLPAADNFLVENAKLVTDAISISCQTQRGHGVQKTSWGNNRGEGCGGWWLRETRLSTALNIIVSQEEAGAHQPGDPVLHCLDQHLPRCPAAPPCPDPAEEHIDIMFLCSRLTVKPARQKPESFGPGPSSSLSVRREF